MKKKYGAHKVNSQVDVSVNGILTPLLMKVGDAGEAFFVIETANPVPIDYATSPIMLPNTNTEEVDTLKLPDADQVTVGHKRVQSATEYRAVVNTEAIHGMLLIASKG